MTMASPAERTLGLDFAALDAITEAVESGAGLPDVVRAAARVLAIAERGARAVVASTIAAPADRDSAAAEVVLLVPGGEDAVAKRAAEGVLRELQASLPGHTFALGRSRVADDPLDLHRAGNEALLAVNVAEGDEEHPLLAFEQTGAYRLLLSAMSEDPAELQRFY